MSGSGKALKLSRLPDAASGDHKLAAPVG